MLPSAAFSYAPLQLVTPTHFSEADLFGNTGFMEACITVIVGAVIVWPAWRIVGKTGHPGLLGLVAFVPLLNILLVPVLAFSERPSNGSSASWSGGAHRSGRSQCVG